MRNPVKSEDKRTIDKAETNFIESEIDFESFTHRQMHMHLYAEIFTNLKSCKDQLDGLMEGKVEREREREREWGKEAAVDRF